MVWPLPALGAWALAWASFATLRLAATPALLAVALATGLGALLAVLGSTPWRRTFIAAGFPLSLLVTGAATLPAWGWLLPLLLLAALYPLNTWRDAPLFPTPTRALEGLEARVRLPDGAAVLDGGCGLGDGLIELRRVLPRVQLTGIEWSWPLALACRARCRLAGADARVRRGDLWGADWSAFQLVYLFQRPESMPRALEKARRELAPGSWLVSLEFELPGVAPTASLAGEGRKPVWLYRL